MFGELDLACLAVLGHSHGGAAATMAAAQDARIRACVALAPVNHGNRAKVIAAAGEVRAPFLVIAGSSDWLATNKTYTRPIYKAAAKATARQYVEVRGGGHNLYTGGGEKERLATGYLTAWLERFLGVAPDRGGWTDGTRARRDREAQKLSDWGTSTGLAARLAG